MIRLFKVKEKHRELAENGKTAIKKQSAGELRLHKGFCSRSLVSNNVFFLTFTIRNIFVLVVVSVHPELLTNLYQYKLSILVGKAVFKLDCTL